MFEVRSVRTFANWSFSVPPRTYWAIFRWRKSTTSIFSTSYYDKKMKHTSGIRFHKRSWLMTSSPWQGDLFWKQLLVCKLHSSHMTRMMITSINSFFRAIAGQNFISTPCLKVDVSGVPHPLNHGCKKNSS